MADWLVAEGVTTVAMESTGAYWWPVWHVLEERDGLELLLVEAGLGHEAGPQQPTLGQLRGRGGVGHVGLAPGDVVGVPGRRRRLPGPGGGLVQSP